MPQSLSENPPARESGNQGELLRVLGVVTAASLVVGNTIGSGIFVKPGGIAQSLGSFPLIISAWILGGLLCLFGGLCLAELAAMLPRAGGLYVYLREAFGPLAGFLFGWNEFLFNRPAATGALSIIFVRSAGRLVGVEMSNLSEVGGAVLAIVVLGWINVRGVAWGGSIQVATTFIKVAFLALVILLPFALWPWGHSTIELANLTQPEPPEISGSLATRFGMVLLAVMWAYNGWHGVAPVAEEIRRPERNIPLALLAGIGIIVALYLGANIAFHAALPMEQVMQSGERTGELLLESLLGPAGGLAMALVLMCSTLGAMNGDLLIGPRISFAMGRDQVFFSSFAAVHPVFRTPYVAIVVQTCMTCALVVGTGLLVEFNPRFQSDSTFNLLTNFVIFAASIFYALAVLAVPVLRWRQADRPRPYRTLGYPVVPLAYLIVYGWFLTEVYRGRPFEARIGLILIALGIPVYLVFAARKRRLLNAAVIL